MIGGPIRIFAKKLASMTWGRRGVPGPGGRCLQGRGLSPEGPPRSSAINPGANLTPGVDSVLVHGDLCFCTRVASGSAESMGRVQEIDRAAWEPCVRRGEPRERAKHSWSEAKLRDRVKQCVRIFERSAPNIVENGFRTLSERAWHACSTKSWYYLRV